VATTTLEAHVKNMVLYAQQQTPELTDVSPGSVFRSIFEATGGSLELLEWRIVDRLESSLQESAYRVFAFDRKAAQAASGNLTLTATATISVAIPIPAGTRFQVPGTDKVYYSTSVKTFPIGASGSTLVVPVASVGVGRSYNTGSGTITQLVNVVSPLLSVTNAVAITNGADVESDDDRLLRFRSFIRSLHRGTADAIEYGVEQCVVKDVNGNIIESVYDAKVVDGSAGTCTVYFCNSSGTATSGALLATVQSAVATYKAAGVTATSTSATLTNQAVSVALTLDPAYTLAMVKTSVETAINELLKGLRIGAPLYLYQLARAVLAIPGVLDATFSAPTGNVVPASSARVVLNAAPTIT
jgi:uncharacterized phage protein gp47/JayE